jgi:hypothetical protein
MQITFPAADRSRKQMKRLQHLFVAGSMILLTHGANADYTVIDDDLLPTKMIQSRLPQQQLPQTHHTIAFTKGYSRLTLPARDALNALLPLMQGASIRIVGHSDAQRYARLASNRAKSIREYLVRQGIPDSSIVSDIDNTPNPHTNGSIYSSDLYITRLETRAPSPYPAALEFFAPSAPPPTYAQQIPQQQPQQRMVAPTPAPTQSPYVVIAAPTPARAEQDQLIQYINHAVQSGQMEPAVAIKLIRQMMVSGQPTIQQAPAQQIQKPPQEQIAVQLQPQPQQPEPLFVATPALVRKETWKLDKALTLRENVDAWSKLAGWNPTAWEAANFYEVKRSSTLEGGFPDILRQIADNTGLNICAKKREKYVRVTDSTVSCKD